MSIDERTRGAYQAAQRLIQRQINEMLAERRSRNTPRLSETQGAFNSGYEKALVDICAMLQEGDSP